MPTKKPAGSATWIDPDDAPELTADMLERAEVFEGDSFVRRGPGRPKSAAAKEQISVRLDPDVLTALRAAGPGWQSQINALLRQALALDGVPAKKNTLSRQLRTGRFHIAPAIGQAHNKKRA